MKMPNMNVISQVSIKGGMDGYILTVSDSLGFKDDMALMPQELSQIYQILKKRFEKNTPKARNKSDEKKRVQEKNSVSKVYEEWIKPYVKKELSKKTKASKKKVTKSAKKRTR